MDYCFVINNDYLIIGCCNYIYDGFLFVCKVIINCVLFLGWLCVDNWLLNELIICCEIDKFKFKLLLVLVL